MEMTCETCPENIADCEGDSIKCRESFPQFPFVRIPRPIYPQHEHNTSAPECNLKGVGLARGLHCGGRGPPPPVNFPECTVGRQGYTSAHTSSPPPCSNTIASVPERLSAPCVSPSTWGEEIPWGKRLTPHVNIDLHTSTETRV